MKNFFVLLMCLVTVKGMCKELNVDMYGADPQLTQHILKKYGAQVSDLSLQFHQKTLKNSEADDFKKLYEERAHLIDQIKKEGNFIHADLQTVIYSEKKIVTTIEVIKQKDKQRLAYLNPDPDKRRQQQPIPRTHNDLIDEMNTYLELSGQLFIKGEIIPAECPVYHCSSGFKHPKLEHFLKIFNQGVIKNKALILKTLAGDTDPKRRAAAVFLMGHLTNPKEIMTILIPYINDKDDIVRNNAMRVIGSTMDAAKWYDINITPFVAMLDSPYNTDRNKALYILSRAIQLDKNKYQVAQCAKDKLLALLALKQPNNHEFAYIILKEISQKDLGEKNISAWKQWLYSNPYSVKCVS